MKPVVFKDGAAAVKRYPLLGRFDASTIAEQTDAFRACGVATPDARLGSDNNELRLAWISGLTLRDMMAGTGPIDCPQQLEKHANSLRGTLKVLACLHRVEITATALRFHSPFHHVDRRLQAESMAMKRLPLRLAEQAHHCRHLLRHIPAPAAVKCVIHGDFHVGQMILEDETSKWWMLDLDDTALGWPEADLGNFAAHLITSADLYTGALDDGFDQLSYLLRDLYKEVAGARLSSLRMRLFGSAALLRRALKLAERGATESLVGQILTVSEKLIR